KKKVSGIEIVVVIVSILIMVLAVGDAYRISTLFYGMPLEQSYIYETTIFGVPLMIFMLYIVVFVNYKKQEFARAYILFRLFPSILLNLYIIGYLFGLNYEHIRNISGAFSYELLIPLWLHIIYFITFMSFNAYMLYKSYKNRAYKRLVNIYSILLVIFYLILFSAVITDSSSYLGLFDWT
ncbi:MAG: hypothetical protein KAH16_05210, partial [Candidatus Izimaplasma sp.]|nr:hypothetical protein [Candidatus Izimaplasma bacterium]